MKVYGRRRFYNNAYPHSVKRYNTYERLISKDQLDANDQLRKFIIEYFTSEFTRRAKREIEEEESESDSSSLNHDAYLVFTLVVTTFLSILYAALTLVYGFATIIRYLFTDYPKKKPKKEEPPTDDVVVTIVKAVAWVFRDPS